MHNNVNSQTTCCTCFESYHIQYFDPNMMNDQWLCMKCTADIFPFNSFDDDCMFRESIQSFFGICVVPFDISNLIFDPFELNNEDELTPLHEIDPDVNYFNHGYVPRDNCKYYNEHSFNKKFDDKNNFSVFHLNVRSLPKNQCDLVNYLNTLNTEFSVIGLSETWLNTNNCTLYDIDNYDHVCQYRQNKKGGGVSLFIKSDITYKVIDPLKVNDEFMECIFVEIDDCHVCPGKKSVLVGVVYRPPNTNLSDFNSRLEGILQLLKKENKLVYIMGDFNVNLLGIDTHPASSDFLNLLYAYAFFPLINKPTRVQNDTATIIDNIYCNYDYNEKLVNGILVTDISDHFPIFSINHSTELNKTVNYFYSRSFSQRNIEKFLNMLNEFDWNHLYSHTDCNLAFTYFHSNYKKIYDTCFPTKRTKKGYLNKKPWLSMALKNSIKTKNLLFLKSRKDPSLATVTSYKTYRNLLNSLLRKAEKQHYHELMENNKNNLRKSWQIIKNIINRRNDTKTNKKFLVDNRLITDRMAIADGFNDFYINVGANLAKSIPTNTNDPMAYMTDLYNNNSIYLCPTNDDEIRKVVALCKNSSAGWDGINAKMVKCSLNTILKPLVHLINLSLTQGKFPNELKLARVIPLFKSGDCQLFKNYRPVSVLPFFSKIYERIMHNRLLDFVDKNKLLYSYQFGFRPSHNTNNALMLLVDKILTGFDKNEITIGVFIDFSKAFDTVNHELLLKKLYRYGIRGVAHNWLTDYMNNRKQYVHYDGISSSTGNISCGVPQGSILGPLLFILYINDISKVSDNLCSILFADDSSFFIQGKDVTLMTSILNIELRKLVLWIQSNKLSLNVEKTNFILFKPRKKRIHESINIDINSRQIERIYHTKFLGIYISCDLSWDHHTRYISSKISKGIGIIYKLRKYLSFKTLLSMYYTFVFPYINYCIEIWGATTKHNLLTLHKLQKKAVRIITFSNYTEHTCPLFESLTVLNIYKLFVHYVGLFMFKSYNRLTPPSLRYMFNHNREYHDHETRQHHHYHVPIFNTQICQRNIRYNGVITWNYILENIEINCSYHSFKHRLKVQLLSNDVMEKMVLRY